MPEHEKFIITSTKYASEKQILSIANSQNKITLIPLINAQEVNTQLGKDHGSKNNRL